MKQVDSERIRFLRQKLKKQKYISIFLALFTLGVNIFAWFAFSANAGLRLEGTVSSWDVEFKDNDVVSRNILVQVNMKPGMSDYTKTVDIETQSDVLSEFSYQFLSLSILGVDINLDALDDVEDYLETYYPFSITTLASKTTLSQNDSITFDIMVKWPFESATPKYFAQNDVYSFNETLTYFKKVNNSYVNGNITTSTLYDAQKSDLYLDKDDADSYFGMACKDYQDDTGQACVQMEMLLVVEQLLN